MAYNAKRLIAGTILHFAEEDAGGTPPVTASAIPTATALDFETTAAPWVLLGTVQGSSTTPNMESKELKMCAPGLRVTAEEIVTSIKIEHRFELGEYNDTVHQLLNAIAASGDAPYTGVVQKKGWLHMARYDHTNTLVSKEQVWGNLKLDGAVDFNDDFVKPKFIFTVLQNAAAKSEFPVTP